MKFHIKIVFVAVFLTSFLNGATQNKINWISWDNMIKQRDSDSIKKKVFIHSSNFECELGVIGYWYEHYPRSFQRTYRKKIYQ